MEYGSHRHEEMQPRRSRSRPRPRTERRRSQPQRSPGPDIEALADTYYETGDALHDLTQPSSFQPGCRPARLSSGPAPSHPRPIRYEHGYGYEPRLHIPPRYAQRPHAEYAAYGPDGADNIIDPDADSPQGVAHERPPRRWGSPVVDAVHSGPHLSGGPPGLGVDEPIEQPLGREIILYFFYMRHGKSIASGQAVPYVTGHPDYDDPWFARTLKRQYKRIREPISLRGIGFVNFFRYERQNKNDFLTAKEPAIPYTGPRSIGHFKYLIRYPQPKKRQFVGKLDALYQNAKDRKCFMTIEIVETVDAGKIYWGLGLIIFLSLATALIYAGLRNDVSGGFTIASYLIACLALVGALLAAGEWLGLAAPDTSAFQLDLQTGDVATNGDVGRFVGRGLGRSYVAH